MEDEEVDVDKLVEVVRRGDVSWLQQHASSPARLVSATNAQGFSLLHWACAGGDVAMVRYLLEAGCPPCRPASNPQQAHALHWAVTHGHPRVVEELLRCGESVEVRDGAGCSPLITAAQYGQATTAAYLLGRGAEIHASDGNGDTALHWAAFKGFPDLLTLLIYSGLNPHVKDKFGQTALHLASLAGHLRAVKQICSLVQVNVHERDNNGRSSVDLARAKGFHELVQYLEGEGARRQSSMKPLSHIWYILFGPPGKSKLAMIFFILSFLAWAYPIYTLKFLPLHSESIAIHLIFVISNVIMWLTFYRAYKSDPGFIPTNTEQYDLAIRQMSSASYWDECGFLGGVLDKLCHTCRTIKPLRSKHCKICDRCVIHFDHHCPWIYNCVGLNNRVWFFAYVVSVTVTLWIGTYFAYRMVHIEGWLLFNSIIILLAILFSVITLILMSGLCFQALMNMTTNEIYNARKYSYLKDKQGKPRNPFFKDPIRNVLEFFHLARLPLSTLDGGVFLNNVTNIKVM